ncbi:DnaT-like ssDNA-binding domain-containing protein [Pseudomonas sp. S9]|uniref:DnaT-like ssDNA-binding domain-containing protein n=1 Tax=Pseudomonas sp. S9 TaxID=686578 RepID=UPI0002556DDE|nr:DnaT-like ssDNA-binding domain-containing protein [Pseudomonas sp. S9]
MAGDWIKFELTTLDKPEVYQIAELADIDPDAVVGKLMRVWSWFDQQTENSNAPSVTKKLLDRSVGVTGFCEYMKSVGWMSEADGVISLPHFERHNGKTAKNRLLTAKRAANHRASSNKSNASTVTSALPKEDVDLDLKASLKGQGHINPNDPIEMSLDWVPCPKLLKAYAFRAGLNPDLFTQEAIGPFACHYKPLNRLETQEAWVSLLVKWFVREKAFNAGNVHKFPAKQANGPDFESQAWREDDGGEL